MAFIHDFRPPFRDRGWFDSADRLRFSPYTFRPPPGYDHRRRRHEPCYWHLPHDLRQHLFPPEYSIRPGETIGYQNYGGLGWRRGGLEDIDEDFVEGKRHIVGGQGAKEARPVWYSVHESEDEDERMAAQDRVEDYHRSGGFAEEIFDVEEMEDGDGDGEQRSDGGERAGGMQRDAEANDKTVPEDGDADQHIVLDTDTEDIENSPGDDPMPDTPPPPSPDVRYYPTTHQPPHPFSPSSRWQSEPSFLSARLQELLIREARVTAQEAQLRHDQIRLGLDRAVLQEGQRVVMEREQELSELQYLLEAERQRVQELHMRLRSRLRPPLRPSTRFWGNGYEEPTFEEDVNIEMSDGGDLDDEMPSMCGRNFPMFDSV